VAAAAPRGAPLGVGVDVEPLATFRAPASGFLARNFSPAEAAYCAGAADPAASLAGRWAAKEAVVKALTAAAQAVLGVGARGLVLAGAGAGLLDVEIVPTVAPVGGAAAQALGLTTSAAPLCRLSGRALALAAQAGVSAEGGVKVTISHAAGFAVAVAVVN